MTQPSEQKIARQRGSPNTRTERMSLAAYLAAGIGLAGIASTADAAIVNIDITDTRGDGNTTTDDNISGVNGGLSRGGASVISDWLGAGTGTLVLTNADVGGFYGNYTYWGLGGGSLGSSGSLEFALRPFGVVAAPRNFAATNQIDGSASWSPYVYDTVFKYSYNSNTTTSPDFTSGSYMGFRLVGNDFNYGWLEVTWDGTSENWQILSGAYETTVNTAIAAGQGAASVPAPSPASLLALIVGGAALRQWRRGRRKQRLLENANA